MNDNSQNLNEVTDGENLVLCKECNIKYVDITRNKDGICLDCLIGTEQSLNEDL